MTQKAQPEAKQLRKSSVAARLSSRLTSEAYDKLKRYQVRLEANLGYTVSTNYALNSLLMSLGV